MKESTARLVELVNNLTTEERIALTRKLDIKPVTFLLIALQEMQEAKERGEGKRTLPEAIEQLREVVAVLL